VVCGQRNGLEEDNVALQEEVIKLRKHITEYQNRNGELIDEVDKLHKGRGEHIHKLTREVEALQKDAKLFDKRLAERTAVGDKYANLNEEKALRIMTLEKELEEFRDECVSLHDELFEVREELEPSETPNVAKVTPTNQPLYPHYYRPVPENVTHVDIDWVLKSWNVGCVEGHAIKKLLCAGQRGVKDKLQDLNEARNSVNRAIELEETK
jgi:hypothetical protein